MLKILIGVLALVLVIIIGGWLYLRGPEIPFETLEARYANADSRFIDLADGVRLHYRDEGKKDGPLLLLVHGGGDNLWTWDGWVKHLAKDYHIIRIDLPGHGLTRAPEDYVFGGDVISQLVDKLHLQRFVIGGSSLGGLASWNYAVAHPEHVRGLILVDSAGLPDVAKTGKAPLAFRILRYSWGRWFLEHIDNKPLIIDSLKAEMGHKDAVTPELVDRWAELQRAPGHRKILISGLAAGVAAPDKTAVLAKLHSIKTPTLILWGAVDPLTPVANGHAFHDAIAGSRLIVYPATGHLPQIEIPDQSAADAVAFLSGLPPDSAVHP